MMYYFKDSGDGFYAVADLSVQLPDGCLPITEEEAEALRPVPPPKSIAEIWTAIKAERDHRTETLGYMAAGKRFHSDQKSRTQQLGLVLKGEGIPAGLQWKTMGGGFVTMTPTLAQQILGGAVLSDMAIFAAAEAHRVAMETSEDPAAYDFTAGWP